MADVPKKLSEKPQAAELLSGDELYIIRGGSSFRVESDEVKDFTAPNLGYTASPTGGTVTNDTVGTDSPIPLAAGINAGLLSPSEKSEIAANTLALSGKGQANGLAELDGSTVVPNTQISVSSVTQHVASIDHDALLNYAANQHSVLNDASNLTNEVFSASHINTLIAGVNASKIWKDNVDTSTENLGDITLSGEQTLNGVLTSSSRVFVVEQADGTENGIYVTGTPWVRSTDLDEGAEFTSGVQARVDNSSSTVNGVGYFMLDVPPTVTIGVTVLNFARSAPLELGTGAGQAAPGNDARIPTQDENNALVGTNGAPSTGNPYVTQSDIGTGVQAFDVDTVKTDVANTYTQIQDFGSNINSNLPIITYSNTRTFALSDANKNLQYTSSASRNLNVPLNATTPFIIGTVIKVTPTNIGRLTIVPVVGVTIISKFPLLLLARGISGWFLKTGTDTWMFETENSYFLDIVSINASLTIGIADSYKEIQISSAPNRSVTVPLDSVTPFPIGTRIKVTRLGAGSVTFIATVGVTIVTKSTLTITKLNGTAELINIGVDSWLLTGDVANTAETDVANTYTQEQTFNDKIIASTPFAGTVTTATYTAVIGDKNKVTRMDRATAQTVTIPPNSSEAFLLADELLYTQRGVGNITFAPGAGVTLVKPASAANLTSAGNGESFVLKQDPIDTWHINGGLT